MQIEVKGRNVTVTDELRECVQRPLREGGQAGELTRAYSRWS